MCEEILMLPADSFPGGPGALAPPPDPPTLPALLLASWEALLDVAPVAASREAAAGTTVEGDPPEGEPAEGVNTPGGTADMEDEPPVWPAGPLEFELPPELDMCAARRMQAW